MDESLLGGDDKVDEGGGAAGDSSLSALIKIVYGCGAHERQLQVHVGVDTTWHDQLASGVKYFIEVSIRMQLICRVVDTLNLVSFDDYISLELTVSVYNRTVLNEV